MFFPRGIVSVGIFPSLMHQGEIARECRPDSDSSRHLECPWTGQLLSFENDADAYDDAGGGA